ncbi:hypothetical protein [Actinocrispum sp. NPDC049592]|uniref:hypothetical protein n=1 Tax=Actinocrispum sp. NPDC049592 TaxID=3154835 RepID=UPI00343C5B2E
MSVDTAFEEALTKVSELVEKLRGAWDEIVSGVNHVLGILPGFLEGPVKSAFDKCANKVSEVFSEIQKLFTERGSASALRTAGDSWNEQIGHRASTQAGLLVKEQLETDNEWTGDAADRYGEAVTAQNKALAQIKTITETLQTTLNEIASALKVFWVGIAIAFGTYVALMIGCIVGAATVVATVPSLLAALGFSVAFLASVATLSNNFANTLDEKKAKLDQQATMDGQFANGQWPSAVTDKMADASVKDGDKSDWTPK